jgi:hypothetical protein
MLRLGGAAVLALLGAGCTAGAWMDRAHDFGQILDASITVGPGMAASARVTELAQVGFGDVRGMTAGWIDGRGAIADEERSELGVSLLHTYEYRRESRQLLDVNHPRFGDPGFVEHPLSWAMETDRNDLDVGANLHVALIGVNVAFHVNEAWDFLCGCFGLDPLHDDAHGRPAEVVQKQALSLDATTRNRAFDCLLRRGIATHGYAIYTAPDARPSYQRRAMEAVQADALLEPGAR